MQKHRPNLFETQYTYTNVIVAPMRALCFKLSYSRVEKGNRQNGKEKEPLQAI